MRRTQFAMIAALVLCMLPAAARLGRVHAHTPETPTQLKLKSLLVTLDVLGATQLMPGGNGYGSGPDSVEEDVTFTADKNGGLALAYVELGSAPDGSTAAPGTLVAMAADGTGLKDDLVQALQNQGAMPLDRSYVDLGSAGALDSDHIASMKGTLDGLEYTLDEQAFTKGTVAGLVRYSAPTAPGYAHSLSILLNAQAQALEH